MEPKVLRVLKDLNKGEAGCHTTTRTVVLRVGLLGPVVVKKEEV